VIHHVVILLGGAVIGGVVAVLMTTMIFFPKQPVKVGPWVFHGFFYQQWPKVMEKLATVIASKIDVAVMVEQLEVETEVVTLFDERFGNILDDFKKEMPMVAMFLNENVANAIKDIVKRQLMKLIPDLKKRLSGRFNETIDFTLLMQKALDDVETLAKEELRRPRRQICWLGMTVGLVIGVLELLIIG